MVLGSSGAGVERTKDDVDQGRDESARPLLAPGAAIGRYLILKRIGVGSMGVVMAAHDPELDRKVAIKLLRSDLHEQAARVRLLREAQALARLGHPNVVTVHDVGEFEGRVYVVMEFIDGEDIRRWQRRRHGWRAVVRVYMQAGRGLAAAHSAGLVHRDFKPANVMIDEDGRVRVTDFGLARVSPTIEVVDAVADHPVDPTPPTPVPRERSSPRPWHRITGRFMVGEPAASESETPLSTPLASEITHAGALLGTPAYMAPEQFGGATADLRSDQFAFCVAFYEALYGERPFAGDSLADLLTALSNNEVRPAPRRSRVPKWLRAALLRGLHNDPEQRWPSMDALLEVIERTPVKRRRWELGGVVGLAAAGVVGFSLSRSPDKGVPEEACTGAEDKLAEVWSTTDRERVRMAFATSERPYAPHILAQVERELERYGQAWVQMYTEACEATHLRWEQSTEVLDQRMRCLDRSRRDLSALVDVLAEANAEPEIVDRALAATENLAPIERCADIEAVREVPVPDEPEQMLRVETLRNGLADATALQMTGQLEAAEDAAESLTSQAETLGYDPVNAELEFLFGRLARERGAFERSRESFEAAYFRALGHGYTRLASEAAIELIFVVGQELAEPERAHDWIRHAQALVQARGNDRLASARVERYRVNVLMQEGRYAEALEVGRDALVVTEALAGPASFEVAAIHNNLGATLTQLGRWAEAEEELQTSVNLLEQLLGPHHPKVAISLGNLGAVQAMIGHTEDAIATYLRSIESLTRAYGPDHPALGPLHVNLGLARQLEGDDEAALRELDEAQRLFEQQLGDTHPKVAMALRGKAEVQLVLRHPHRAEQAARAALMVLETNLEAGHPELARAHVLLAQTLLAQARHDEAQLELASALASFEGGELEDARLAYAWQVRGELLLARGELERARGELERAQSLWAQADRSTERARGLAATRLALCRALGELGREDDAAELAHLALAELEEGVPDARLRRIARSLRSIAPRERGE